jgi:hypothetical protein
MVAVEIKPDGPDYTLNKLREILSSGKYDTVYTTIIFSWYAYFIYIVAKEFPQINFIVGGSGAIWLTKIYPSEKIPILPNFKLSSESLQSIFPSNFHEKQWGLNLPEMGENIKNVSVVMCDTTRSCTWGRCKFCHINHCFSHINTIGDPILNIIKFLPKELTNYKNTTITMGFPDTTLDELRELVPIFNYDTRISYIGYLSAIRKNQMDEFKSIISEIKDPKRISFSIGAEFLSDRMLKYIRKAANLNEYIETINFLQSLNIIIHLNLLIRLNTLIVDDVKEFTSTLKKIDCSKIHMDLNELCMNTANEKNFEPDFKDCEKIPVYVPFYPDYPIDSETRIYRNKAISFYYFKITNPTQVRLNDIMEEIINNAGFIVRKDAYYWSKLLYKKKV